MLFPEVKLGNVSKEIACTLYGAQEGHRNVFLSFLSCSQLVSHYHKILN